VPQSTLLEEIGQKDADKEEIADKVAASPELLPEVLGGLGAKKAPVRYGCAKVLRILSEKQPRVLYPYIDSFIALLDSDNSIMKWEAIHVIGNLAVVDGGKKIDGILGTYLAPIPGPVLVTAANVIGGAGKIASAKPHLADRVASEMLKVEHARYRTAECRNVALGQAIDSFDLFFEHIQDKQPVIGLIERQLANTRNNTRKKAEKVLKKRRS
jgi:hypothetical protein